MIACTSLSPTHINKDIQQKAINSWKALGIKPYSFNHPNEIESLSHYKNIEFVPTTKTLHHIFKKPYISITAMIDWAKEQDDTEIMFINSDIELAPDKRLLNRIYFNLRDYVIIANRYDYEKTKAKIKKYELGFDAFFLHKKYLDILPPSLFCMGQCFWDYNIPFTAIKNGIEVINLQNKFAFHKSHPIQYSPKNWETTGKLFTMEHDIENNDIGSVNMLAFNFIELHSKKITL